MPYEIDSVFGGFTATAAAAPEPTLVAEAVPEIQTDIRTGADGADRDPLTRRIDHSPIESKDEASESKDESDAEESGDDAPKTSDGDRYQFSLRFVWDIHRPLMELVDTETQEPLYSYPPESRARMFAEADALATKVFDEDADPKVDASA